MVSEQLPADATVVSAIWVGYVKHTLSVLKQLHILFFTKPTIFMFDQIYKKKY